MKIINVMASSLDGRIGVEKIEGDQARQNEGLSSVSDQEHLRTEIESSEAIIVGASSIRANRECLDHPGSTGKPPIWIVLAASEIPKEYKFWQQKHIPRIIVSNKNLPIYDTSVELFQSNDPTGQVKQLLERFGVERALLFGGGIVNSWFYSKKLVHELVITIAPKLVGRNDSPFLLDPSLLESVNLQLLSSKVSENFVFLRYAVLP